MPKDKDLDLNSSADLPSGSSTQGATRSAMGHARMADVKRGFFDADAPDPRYDDGTGSNDCCAEPEKPYGFAGRPQGWER